MVVFETKLNTTNYEVLNNNEIRLYDYLDEPELVVETLVNNEVKVSSIIQTGTNLEDYFIKLVGGNRHA